MHIPHTRLFLLHRLWSARLAGRPMPDRSDFFPEDFFPWSGHIGIVRAERDGGGIVRWRITLSGLAVVAYDGADWTGRLLDETVPEHVRPAIMKPFGDMLESRAPVYDLLDSGSPERPSLPLSKYHRLLLPVTDGGEAIERALVGIYAEPEGDSGRATVYDAMEAAAIAKAWSTGA